MDLPHIKFWLFEMGTLYGRDGEHVNPYMHRVILGRLRFHWFVRGDNDPDAHDHPWEFWTFPLTGYVEEVTWWRPGPRGGGSWSVRRQTVKAWRIHHRPASHTHRVLGRAKVTRYPSAVSRKTFAATTVGAGPILTIVWTGASKQKWGFLKNRDGKWCWQDWRSYIFGGGKSAPCVEDEGPRDGNR